MLITSLYISSSPTGRCFKSLIDTLKKSRYIMFKTRGKISLVVQWLLCYAKSLQSCPTLCDPIDGSPPGFSVPGILQARTLEWVAICISTEGGVGSVPGGGTKIANAAV